MNNQLVGSACLWMWLWLLVATHCQFQLPVGADDGNGGHRHHNDADSEPVIGNAAPDNVDKWPLVDLNPN